MDFSPNEMQNLVNLLRAPEPEILQGEDLTSTGISLLFFEIFILNFKLNLAFIILVRIV